MQYTRPTSIDKDKRKVKIHDKHYLNQLKEWHVNESSRNIN